MSFNSVPDLNTRLTKNPFAMAVAISPTNAFGIPNKDQFFAFTSNFGQCDYPTRKISDRMYDDVVRAALDPAWVKKQERIELKLIHKSLPFNTDSYKASMFKQYPPGTEYVFSYIESRGGEFDRVVHMGVQPFMEYLSNTITQEQVDLAAEAWDVHGEPFPKEGWDYIVQKLDGKIPVRIRSVAEGLVIPTRNVLVTIENTDPMVPWITTWIETALLRAVWYMSTVATTSWHIKELINGYYETSVDEDAQASLLFRLHDFGARGVSSAESAELGAAGHLVSFLGSDTFSAMLFMSTAYDAPMDSITFSIPASEHSTITGWTRAKEPEAYLNMIDTFAKPGGLFACVMDSYDVLAATQMVSDPDGKHFKLLNERGGLMALRPDSDDPAVIIPRMLHILEKNSGSKINGKGFKVLNNFRIVWGDGITPQVISSILRIVVNVMGYSAENFVFGMGGRLLQIVNRDTQEYAMKCSALCANGVWHDVYKQPNGIISKASKKGKVTLVKNVDNLYCAVLQEEGMPDELHEVFLNGQVGKRWTLAEVRANAALPPVDNAPVGHSASVYPCM